MPRTNFASLFLRNADGSIEPKQQIRVGGITISPATKIARGTLIAGIDFSNFSDRDFEVKTDGNVLVITGIY